MNSDVTPYKRSGELRIPTRKECLHLMNQYGMLNNIIHHSLKVAKVATFIAKELNKKGHNMNIELVEASSLLHDITKTKCLFTEEDHAKTGYKLLKELGYERVGEIVGEHIQLSKISNSLWVKEEELVNYADKRVLHNRIVSLEDRFKDLRNRYGKSRKGIEKIEELKKRTMEIEKKIFSFLDITPTEIFQLNEEEKE